MVYYYTPALLQKKKMKKSKNCGPGRAFKSASIVLTVSTFVQNLHFIQEFMLTVQFKCRKTDTKTCRNVDCSTRAKERNQKPKRI